MATLEGAPAIPAMLTAPLELVKPTGFRIATGESADHSGEVQQAWIGFETATGRGQGHIRVRNGKIWTLLKELKEHEEHFGTTRRKGTEHGAQSDRKSWAQKREETAVAAGMTTNKADMTFASIPYGLLADFQKPTYDTIRAEDAAFYAALAEADFKLDYGDDDTGLFMKCLRRGSGYYIDVGAGRLIVDGRVKLKSGSDVSDLTQTGVVLQDGTELPTAMPILR